MKRMYMIMLLSSPLLSILLLIAQAEKDIKIYREIKRMYMIMLLIFPLLLILLLIAQTEKDIKIERG
jgi:hypothetical protein